MNNIKLLICKEMPADSKRLMLIKSSLERLSWGWGSFITFFSDLMLYRGHLFKPFLIKKIEIMA